MKVHNQRKLLESDEFKQWKKNFLAGVDQFRLGELVSGFILESPKVSTTLSPEDVLRAYGLQSVERHGMSLLWDFLLELGEEEGEEATVDYQYDGV